MPAFIGAALIAVRAELLPNLIFIGTYQTDLLGVLTAFGMFVGLAGLLLIVVARWFDRLIQRSRLVEKESQSASHRDFLRRLDHEIHNPLTTIRLGLLNIEQNSAADHQETITRIIQQAQRLQNLTGELRFLTEIEECQIERGTVNLSEVLGSVVELVCGMPDNQERTIDLQIQQVPWPVPDVSGDTDLLFMAFRNLLDNALKYTRREDRVFIRANENGHMALIEVADSGIGIAPDDLLHVFEDLYRGQNARGFPGNGLGLALVQRIIDLHAGKTEINSQLDKGTVLRVWLPLAR